MAKKAEGSVNVQGRLTPVEVAELDRAAAEQPVPVKRATIVSHILREWIRHRIESRRKGHK